MEPVVKNYTPEDNSNEQYINITDELNIRIKAEQAREWRMRWQVIEDLMPVLAGKNWVEANGFIVVSR